MNLSFSGVGEDSVTASVRKMNKKVFEWAKKGETGKYNSLDLLGAIGA